MKITNVQNVPRDAKIKNLIIPLREGEVLLEADQSQAESRIVAYKAEEMRLIGLFEHGEKIHEVVGSILWNKQINKKDNPIEYNAAKTISHASNYGTSPQKIAQIILNDLGTAFSIAECREKQNIYFQQFPRIQKLNCKLALLQKD